MSRSRTVQNNSDCTFVREAYDRTERRKIMRERIKHLFSLALALALMCTLSLPAFAASDGNISQYRHSVVCVQVGLQGEGGFYNLAGGTGFFVGEDGTDPQFLLTNHHVIETFIEFGQGELVELSIDEFMWKMWEVTRDDLTDSGWEYIVGMWTSFMGNYESGRLHSKILVYYDDNDYEEAYLVDNNSTKDMALLKLDKPTSKRTPLKVANPADDMVGEEVYAIGFPAIAENEYHEAINKRGEKDATVSKGTLSRLMTETGTGRAAIQTDVDIFHGNSGGPLLLKDGSAIGITSWGVSNWENEGVNYALSMVDVIPMLKRNDVVFDMSDGTSESGGGQSSSKGDSAPAESVQPVVKVEEAQKSSSLPMLIIIVAVVAAAGVVVAVVLSSKKPKPQPQPQMQRTAPPPAPAAPVRPTSPPQSRKANDSGFRLQSLGGTLGNQRVMIPTDKALILGRNPDACNVVFPGDARGISGRHCSVWYENGSIRLKDLGSTHGTFLEPGQRLAGEQTITLMEGQSFWLGSEQERFTIARKQN